MTEHTTSDACDDTAEAVTDATLDALGVPPRADGVYADELNDTTALVTAFAGPMTQLRRDLLHELLPNGTMLPDPWLGHEGHELDEITFEEPFSGGRPVPDWVVGVRCRTCERLIVLVVGDSKRRAPVNASAAVWATNLPRIPSKRWNEQTLPTPSGAGLGRHDPATCECDWHQVRTDARGRVLASFEGQNDLYRGWDWTPEHMVWPQKADDVVFICFHQAATNPFASKGKTRSDWVGRQYGVFMRRAVRLLRERRAQVLSEVTHGRGQESAWLTEDVLAVGALLRALLAPPPPGYAFRVDRPSRVVAKKSALSALNDLWHGRGRRVWSLELPETVVTLDERYFPVLRAEDGGPAPAAEVARWTELILSSGWHLPDTPCRYCRTDRPSSECGHIDEWGYGVPDRDRSPL